MPEVKKIGEDAIITLNNDDIVETTEEKVVVELNKENAVKLISDLLKSII